MRWRVWLGLALMGTLGPAHAGPALQLLDAHSDIDAWPAVRTLADPAAALTPSQAMERLREFAVPAVPHANLGTRTGAMWLHLAVDVPVTESGRRTLMIDYPSLDRVDVHIVSDGQIVRSVRLGDHVLFAQRPVQARPLLLPLVLEPGMEHQLLLRVQTTSSMILPLRLVTPEAIAVEEARFQLVQGIAIGLGLCLFVYSLAHGLQARDPSFLYYGMSNAGITLFFVAYHGLGPQHLWGGSEWMTRNLSPLSVIPAVIGALLFLDVVLEVRALSRRLSVALRAIAVVAGLVGLAFVLDLFDYRTMHLVATVLGPMPIVLGVPAAFLRARQGDRAAMLILVGWCLYGTGIVVMAAYLRGFMPTSVWTAHAFQAGALIEMVMWLMVLGLRASQLRRRAERADRERESLLTLAHTDALTGLANRRGLQRELDLALPRATAAQPLAVFVLDLDGFKAVNDRLGHGAGDELLKAVAGRLLGQLRAGDVVARLGGDEFVVLATRLASPEDACRLGDKLLAAFESSFDLNGSTCRIGGTIGFSLAPQDGASAEALLSCADAAMYRGKQQGKRCLCRSPAEQGVTA